MKDISVIWTLVYKEFGKDPIAFSYDSESEAKKAKTMVEDADGGDLYNETNQPVEVFQLDWVYLIEGKFIENKGGF